jgi:pimeloyl-ACP methyl ester carboxylesterase
MSHPEQSKGTQVIRYKYAAGDSKTILYSEGGPANAPTISLLHGFPTSSHMFRDLIPALTDRYHAVAPDLRGYGFSDSPALRAHHPWAVFQPIRCALWFAR